MMMAALSLPGAAILTLASGALFGLAAGTIAVSFASSIGATLILEALGVRVSHEAALRFAERFLAWRRG